MMDHITHSGKSSSCWMNRYEVSGVAAVHIRPVAAVVVFPGTADR